jgi:hypothetical protein
MKKLILILLLMPCALSAQWRSTHSGSRPAILFPHDSMVFVHWDGGGVSWYTIGALGWAHADSGILPGQSDKKVRCFASIGKYLFAAGPGVNRSTNNGSSWEMLKSSFPNGAYVLGTIDTILLSSWNNAIQRSTDYGNSWTQTFQETTLGFITIDDVIFAGTESKLLRSDDKGLTWSKVSDYGIAQMSLVGPDLYAWGGAISRSIDTGKNWTALNTDGGNGFGAFGSDLFTIGGVFVYHSSDRGDNWSKVDLTGLPGNVELTAMCVFDSFLFVGGYDGTSGFGQGVYYRPISEIVPKSGIVEQSVVQDTILIYPNPTLHRITIQSGDDLRQIELLNVLGESLQLLAPRSVTATLDLSQIPSGTYFLRIETAKGVVFRKIVKE